MKQPEAAQLLNISERSVERAARVLDHGAPALVESVQSGRVAVSTALHRRHLTESQRALIAAKIANLERVVIGEAKISKWKFPL